MAHSPTERLGELLRSARTANPFYAAKFAHLPANVPLEALPFTTKAELAEDQRQHPPYGRARTGSIEQFRRYHQTSGTSTGKPLGWLDTERNWQWLLHCWQVSFPFMGLSPCERMFFPFSFGPFLGFWTAFEAASRAGHLCFAGGGMTSTARLRFILDHGISTVFATPTYALHLSEVAAKEGIDLCQSAVQRLVVAGEPGGCIPATRSRIEAVWGARVHDHYGMTEIGPVAVETEHEPQSLLLLESEYIVEVLEPGTGTPAPEGELVLTNVGRADSPLFRYRTGDIVRWGPRHANGWRSLAGGILGRADDMLHLRGNNIYPAALEAIIRRFADVQEYRLTVDHRGALNDLAIEVETAVPSVAEAVARAIRDELLFRVEVQAVPEGTLPRFEMKAKRIVHNR
jgi:phenylacetate-CoA ligase